MVELEIKKINKEPINKAKDVADIARKAKPPEGLKGEGKVVFRPKYLLREYWG